MKAKCKLTFKTDNEEFVRDILYSTLETPIEQSSYYCGSIAYNDVSGMYSLRVITKFDEEQSFNKFLEMLQSVALGDIRQQTLEIRQNTIGKPASSIMYASGNFLVKTKDQFDKLWYLLHDKISYVYHYDQSDLSESKMLFIGDYIQSFVEVLFIEDLSFNEFKEFADILEVLYSRLQSLCITINLRDKTVNFFDQVKVTFEHYRELINIRDLDRFGYDIIEIAKQSRSINDLLMYAL